MADVILQIEDLAVNAGEIEILRGVNLTVKRGETHVLMGPNGAGKTTLGYALMGNPKYEITRGKVSFMGEDLMEMAVEERAKKGMFLSFQTPIEVPGISLSNFVRNALDLKTGEKTRLWKFRKDLEKELAVLDMDKSYADRDLNVGFSGGEKKKAEILQMLMLKPELAILDETDSGLDIDAVRTVSKGVKEYHETVGGAMIIITHSTKILESLKVDKTHIIVKGKIVKSGGPELVEQVNRNGFEAFM